MLFRDKGLTIIGFPCNQFASQEKLGEKEIKEFVCDKFKVTFPMMSKVKVNGDEAHPLFQYLKKQAGVKSIPWNFAKFLIDGEGKVIKFYDAKLKPKKDVLADICKLIGIQAFCSHIPKFYRPTCSRSHGRRTKEEG